MTTRRLMVATLYTPEIAELGAATAENKAAYCRRHGYSFACETSTLDPSRPPSWSKIRLLYRLLHYHDWVLWIDADAAFANVETRIEPLIERHPAADLIVSKDENGLNAGVFLARGTPSTVTFLAAVWALTQFTDHRWWEQAAMSHLIDSGRADLNIAFAPKRDLNAYPDDYQRGDWILHVPGQPDRLDLLKSIAPQAFGLALQDPEPLPDLELLAALEPSEPIHQLEPKTKSKGLLCRLVAGRRKQAVNPVAEVIE